MNEDRKDLLIPEDASHDELTQPGLPRWMRFGLVATGAAVAVGGFGGVAFADHDDTPKTPESPQTVSPQTVSPQTVATEATVSPLATVDTPTATTPDTTPTVSPATATVTATTPTATNSPTGTNGTVAGLMLGQALHDGLTDEQLAALAGSLGVGEDVVVNMSLGQLLRAAHAAGLSTHDLAMAIQ